ncbi:hypothetical protein BDQ17DRAFT_1430319 [Cyathus striatus]|nr:hypothetical protein BDQ17DRAFT_1430319 [Cyathus striatus]
MIDEAHQLPPTLSHLLQPWQKTLTAHCLRLSKLGEYTVIQDITEGTFGKVNTESSTPTATRTQTGKRPLDDDLNVKMAYVGLSSEISDGDFLTVGPNYAAPESIIEGLGRIEEDVADELARKLKGVEKDEAWEALRLMIGPRGILYVSIFAEKERDAELAAMDPRNALSPAYPLQQAKPKPLRSRIQRLPLFLPLLYHPHPPSTTSSPTENPNFAVLNTSLPAKDANGKEEHHLASFVSARKAGLGKEKRQHKIKRHFGIMSRNPPIEVMFGDL